MAKFIRAWDTNDTPLLINTEHIMFMYEFIGETPADGSYPVIVLSSGRELRLSDKHNGDFFGVSEEIAPDVNWKQNH